LLLQAASPAISTTASATPAARRARICITSR
jgi:hypothetical protein